MRLRPAFAVLLGSATVIAGVTGVTGVAAAAAGATTVPVAARTAAPAVTSVSPSSGPTYGGTRVTVRYTGVTDPLDVTAVTFGGHDAVLYTVGRTSAVVSAPPVGSPGIVAARVITRHGSSTTSSRARFSYVAYPEVTSAEPSAGPTGGGTRVVLHGQHFDGVRQVLFGSTPGTHVYVRSSTLASVTAPASRAPGTTRIRVVTTAATSEHIATYAYGAPPTITSITPAVGGPDGGNTVVIRGTGFPAQPLVTFGDSPRLGYVVSSSPTELRVGTPDHDPGTVDVQTANEFGSSAITAHDQFTYLPKPSPVSGLLIADVTATSATLRWTDPPTGTGTPIGSVEIEND